MKTWKKLIFVILVLVGGCLVVGPGLRGEAAIPVPRACFANQCVLLELAWSPDQRARGLQHRAEFSAREGMLFIFDQPGRHAFWMKDTLIFLDMIWLDESYRVVDRRVNVPPCQVDPCPSYEPTQEAWFVLEVQGGLTEQWGLNEGDQLEIYFH